VNRRFSVELLMTLALLVLATGLIAAANADLVLSSRFYLERGWPVGEQFPWKLLYRIDRTPAVLLALGGLVAAVWGLRSLKMRHWVRPGFFLVIVLALGPGLLVNSVFKEHWGRPRPREIVQFDGTKTFLQPWQPGISGKGRSFPSGHSSAAFYLIAPFFLYRRSRPALARRWLTGGLIFGMLMSYARIAQGGHFLSDCLWAFGMVWLTALLLAEIMGIDRSDAGAETG